MTSQQLGTLLEKTGHPRIGIGPKIVFRCDQEPIIPMRNHQFSCTLPLPPSVNSLYPTRGRRRCKSQEYKSWIGKAELDFLRTILEEYFGYAVRINGAVKVQYDFYFPNDKRRRDGENYCKAVSDFLVERGVIEDDSLIMEMTWRKQRCTGRTGVAITITEIL